jgi:hypothetical protein
MWSSRNKDNIPTSPMYDSYDERTDEDDVKSAKMSMMIDLKVDIDLLGNKLNAGRIVTRNACTTIVDKDYVFNTQNFFKRRTNLIDTYIEEEKKKIV